MFRVEKVLNNNGILAINSNDDCEYIFLGKGIGFHFVKKQTFESIPDAKQYKMQNANSKEDPLSIVNNVDPLYFDITNEIILLAEKKFGSIDNSIFLTLADHIAFSIERMKRGLIINNPFTSDIKALFLEEYEVALDAVEIIKKYTGFTIGEDEIGYITLHIHSALSNEHISRTLSVTHLLGKFVEQMEEKLNIQINRDSLSYNRLITHIKYMITRALKGERLMVDISPYAKAEFYQSYQIAEDLCNELSKKINCEFSDIEVGYLAVHIERVRGIAK